MIPVVTTTKEFDKYFRSELIKLTELDGKFVRNESSIFGADLDKLVDDIYKGLSLNNCLVLFLITSRDDNFVGEYDDNSDKIYTYKSFTCNISMYGDDSTDIAIKTATRFKMPMCHEEMYAKGIHIQRVSDISKTHDYKNDVIWIRNDFTIDFACRMQITSVELPYKPNTLSELKIEEV